VTTFEWTGRCGPLDLMLSEHTFAPSRISMLLAEAMSVRPGETVLDVGCGSGVLAIVAAKLGAGEVHGVDAAPRTIEVASENAELHDVADTCRFYEGDLFDPLPDGLQADLAIGDVSGVADPVARVSGWFPSGSGGGYRGSELPVRMIGDVRDWLAPDGRLLLPTGTLQDEGAILEAARESFDEVEQLTEKRFPLPNDIAEDAGVRALMDEGIIDLVPRGSRFIWYARVWECRISG
jgi:SAM-dependent methyltransferase